MSIAKNLERELVIGLEVHAQLDTDKLFSRGKNEYGAKPNTQCDVVDFALPGALPMPNPDAIKLAIKFALATNGKVPKVTTFDRKSYFYPDLPKGYQITQQFNPISQGGFIEIETQDGKTKKIRIHHAHLEEDAGKSLHHGIYSAVDLNRAGITLLEIVSEPDMRSAEEAICYLKKLHQLIKYFDISNGNMQEGSFRVDVNISVRENDKAPFGTRCEIKNINSFKFIEQAIAYEFKRQSEALDQGHHIYQETRKFIEETQSTESLRIKESADEYRYFPDPDLPAIYISDDLVNSIRQSMGLGPQEKKQQLVEQYQLSDYDARVITQDKNTVRLFDQMVSSGINAKNAANWLMVNIQTLLNKKQQTWENNSLPITNIIKLISCVEEGLISNNQAKELLEEICDKNIDPLVIIEERGLKQISDINIIEKWINEVISENPKQLEQYRQGQTKLFGFFVGQVIKKSQGKVNPSLANELMIKVLS